MQRKEFVRFVLQRLADSNTAINGTIFSWVPNEATDNCFDNNFDGIDHENGEERVVRPLVTPICWAWMGVDILRGVYRQDDSLYNYEEQNEEFEKWPNKKFQ